MTPHEPGYTPRRSFSPVTVQEIRLALTPMPRLRVKYDLGEQEARLLMFTDDPYIDQYGRIAE